MTTDPAPVDNSAYPDAWKPAYIRERDAAAEPLELELALAMDPAERSAMLARIERRRTDADLTIRRL